MVLPFTTVAGHINYTSLLGYYCNGRAVKNNPLRSGSARPAPEKNLFTRWKRWRNAYGRKIAGFILVGAKLHLI
jgi:hypothetical protein